MKYIRGFGPNYRADKVYESLRPYITEYERPDALLRALVDEKETLQTLENDGSLKLIMGAATEGRFIKAGIGAPDKEGNFASYQYFHPTAIHYGYFVRRDKEPGGSTNYYRCHGVILTIINMEQECPAGYFGKRNRRLDEYMYQGVYLSDFLPVDHPLNPFPRHTMSIIGFAEDEELQHLLPSGAASPSDVIDAVPKNYTRKAC